MIFKQDEVYLTEEGLDELEKDLVKMKKQKLPALLKRVARARDFGDLTENSDYANAREELSFVKNRIEELENIIDNAVIIKSGKRKTTIALGTRVTIRGNGQEHIYTLVGDWEADPAKKKISHSSPLGKALMGKKVGEKVQIEAPVGKIVYTIKKIH